MDSVSTPNLAIGDVSTTQTEILGARRAYHHPTHGYQEYIYGFAATAVAQYQLGAFAVGSSKNVAPTTGDEDIQRLCGAPQNSGGVPINNYGWFLRKGQGYLTSDAAIAQGAILREAHASGNGRVDDAAVADASRSVMYFATALANTAAGAGEPILCRLALP